MLDERAWASALLAAELAWPATAALAIAGVSGSLQLAAAPDLEGLTR